MTHMNCTPKVFYLTFGMQFTFGGHFTRHTASSKAEAAADGHRRVRQCIAMCIVIKLAMHVVFPYICNRLNTNRRLIT